MDTISTTSEEVWKDIPGYYGRYKISSLGRVKTFFKDKCGKIMKNQTDKDGYKYIQLCYKGVHKKHKIHRIVMFSFIGSSDMPVDHINQKRDDNRLSNLEYVTIRENILRGDKLKKKRKGCSSRFIGVSRSKNKTNPWKSAVRNGTGKEIFLGYYSSEEEARDAYVKYRKENNLIR